MAAGARETDQIVATALASPIVLLDLSNDRSAALQWLSERLGAHDATVLNKADLKWASKAAILKSLRRIRPGTFAIFCSDLDTQSALNLMLIFLAFSGARTIAVGDRAGRSRISGTARVLLTAPLKLALEALAGYFILVPVAWLLVKLLQAIAPILKSTRRFDPAGRTGSRAAQPEAAAADRPEGSAYPVCRRALYIRATPVSQSNPAATGGMAAHIEGFTRGAHGLGHHLDFISSGPIPISDPASTVRLIPTSALISPTRALFDLWNSLNFSIRALARLKAGYAEIPPDFLYQRYNRVNCTGVILAAATGLPLVLEYNGSEVWIARNWDPVGLMWLVDRVERLNLQMADLIVVVSSEDRNNLVAKGVAAHRILVNPNGVDTDAFRPADSQMRRAVRESIDAKRTSSARRISRPQRVLVGFTGTFGPWHGTDVLAQAAVKLGPASNCHFLFIGDGDMKPRVQSVFSDAGCDEIATFLGSVPHSQVAAYIAACDILVSPHTRMADGSEFFGSPTKLFEYLATANPVVASAVGQMREILTDDENAILVEPGDPAQLAEAILRLAADPRLRQRIGSKGRDAVCAHFTWRHNAARVFDAVGHLT